MGPLSGVRRGLSFDLDPQGEAQPPSLLPNQTLRGPRHAGNVTPAEETRPALVAAVHSVSPEAMWAPAPLPPPGAASILEMDFNFILTK